MQKILSEIDQQKIREATESKERQTAAELVTVIADSSDNYRYIPVLWAAIVSMLTPGLLYSSGFLSEFSKLYAVQVLLFAALSIAFRHPLIKYKLTPKVVLHHRAARMAKQQFYEQKLHHTEMRLGVLFFVSMAERYVEILADTGLNEKVSDQQWQEIVAVFSEQVARDQVTEGFVEAISKTGELLADVAPQHGLPVNALPNHLIILRHEDFDALV